MYFSDNLVEQIEEIVVLAQRRQNTVVGDDGRCEPLFDSSEDNVDITSSNDAFDHNYSGSSLEQAPITESHYNIFEPQEGSLLLANTNVFDSENDDEAAPQSSQQQQQERRSRKNFRKALSSIRRVPSKISIFKKTLTKMPGRFSMFHNSKGDNKSDLRLDCTERTIASTS